MKNYFKSVLLILGLLLFIFGCQKDDVQEPTQDNHQGIKSRLTVNTGNDVSKTAKDYIKFKTNNSLKVSLDKGRILLSSNTAFSRETSMGTIDTSKEIVIENDYNLKHTFKIKSSTLSNSIVNIIIVETDDITYEYFKKYNFTNGILYDINGSIDLNRFTGNIETFNMAGNITGIIVITDGEVIGTGGNNSPCPDDDDIWDGWEDFWDNLNNNTSSGGGSNNTSDP